MTAAHAPTGRTRPAEAPPRHDGRRATSGGEPTARVPAVRDGTTGSHGAGNYTAAKPTRRESLGPIST